MVFDYLCIDEIVAIHIGPVSSAFRDVMQKDA